MSSADSFPAAGLTARQQQKLWKEVFGNGEVGLVEHRRTTEARMDKVERTCDGLDAGIASINKELKEFREEVRSGRGPFSSVNVKVIAAVVLSVLSALGGRSVLGETGVLPGGEQAVRQVAEEAKAAIRASEQIAEAQAAELARQQRVEMKGLLDEVRTLRVAVEAPLPTPSPESTPPLRR